MAKNYDDAYDLLETMAANNYQWPTSRLNQQKVSGKIEVDAITALAAQVSAMSKKIDSMAEGKVQQVEFVCELCAGAHSMDKCAINPEAVNFVGNSYQSNYHAGVRTNANYSWNNNQNQHQAPRPHFHPDFQNHQPQPQHSVQPQHSEKRPEF